MVTLIFLFQKTSLQNAYLKFIQFRPKEKAAFLAAFSLFGNHHCSRNFNSVSLISLTMARLASL